VRALSRSSLAAQSAGRPRPKHRMPQARRRETDDGRGPLTGGSKQLARNAERVAHTPGRNPPASTSCATLSVHRRRSAGRKSNKRGLPPAQASPGERKEPAPAAARDTPKGGQPPRSSAENTGDGPGTCESERRASANAKRPRKAQKDCNRSRNRRRTASSQATPPIARQKLTATAIHAFTADSKSTIARFP